MNSLPLLAATLAAVTLGFVIKGNESRDQCVRTSPDTVGQAVGFELIDVLRGEAWVTTDWSVEAFAAFSPGLSAPHWIKNDPRQSEAGQAVILRSPACLNDGEFTYRTMYGRTFFHIADITRLTGAGLTSGELVESTVNKHHRLEFESGSRLSFLVSPDGQHFVLVNRPVDMGNTPVALPDGWSLKDLRLDHAWRADLIGEVNVIRLQDGASYQGPIISLPIAISEQASSAS